VKCLIEVYINFTSEFDCQAMKHNATKSNSSLYSTQVKSYLTVALISLICKQVATSPKQYKDTVY